MRDLREVRTLIDIRPWLTHYMEALRAAFGHRLWFVGLQGSYGRGEATEESDIDVVVILDALSAEDIERYRALIDTLEHRELVCGFLSGREELRRWEPSDLFQFCHDTTPILGSLETILEAVDAAAVDRAVLMGACNVYHGCVHNMLFGRKVKTLRGLCKAATFAIRADVYRRTGLYCRDLRRLIEHADAEERAVISSYTHMLDDGEAPFKACSETLFAWAQKTITR